MAAPKGFIKCFLCHGAVSIKSGTVDKYKLHIENHHDVFYDVATLVNMALLKPEEIEHIGELAAPRMKALLENQNMFNKKIVESKINGIGKRIRENEDEEASVSARKPSKRPKFSEEENLTSPLSKDVNNSSVEVSDNDNYEVEQVTKESIEDDEPDSSFSKLEIVTDDKEGSDEDASDTNQISISVVQQEESKTGGLKVENIDEKMKAIRARIENLKESGSAGKAGATGFTVPAGRSPVPNLVNCDICDKSMLKKSLVKHRRMCVIRKGGSQTVKSEVAQRAVASPVRDQAVASPRGGKDKELRSFETECSICGKVMLKSNIKRHMRLHEESQADDQVKCKICFASFLELESLRRHTVELHNLQLQDVEEMLGEGPEVNKNLGEGEVEDLPTSESKEEMDNFDQASVDYSLASIASYEVSGYWLGWLQIFGRLFVH